MSNEDILKLIKSGDVLLITKEDLSEAVKQAVTGHLKYADYHDFSKGVEDIEPEQVVFDVIEWLELYY